MFKLSSNRKQLFMETDRRMEYERKIGNLFASGLQSTKLQSEFDEVFGEDPLDFLMSQFAIPILEAEKSRPYIERHGRPQRKHIPIPESLDFEKVQNLMSQQWTERTCPAEFYFERYLRENLMEALEFAFEEANKQNITEDHVNYSP